MKVAFLVNDLQLSGGVGVVVEHARRLAGDHGFETALVVVREQENEHWQYESLAAVDVLTREQALERHFDVAVATWWETTASLFDVPADRYAYFVQSLEDRFYKRDEADRLGASTTLGLPVAFITEAHWIAATLAQVRPDAPCHLVRNGIDKDVFAPVDRVPVRYHAPLRIVVEGDPQVWFKGVPEALKAAAAMKEAHHLTLVTGRRGDALKGFAYDEVVGPLTHREMAELYRRSDVVLKLSSVEGMFGPPLEGFHMGATCVTTPVTGHDEYIEHGWNALVCDWEDVPGTARLLDLLARDRRLLHFLRSNALATARGWPSWAQASQLMALALLRIRREPAPLPGTSAAMALGEIRGHVETNRGLLAERLDFGRKAARLERLVRMPGFRQLRALWRNPKIQEGRVGPFVIGLVKRILR